MPPNKLQRRKRYWTAAELRRMLPEKRDAILAASVTSAEKEYRLETQLTAFEAFSEADLHGDSSDSADQSR